MHLWLILLWECWNSKLRISFKQNELQFEACLSYFFHYQEHCFCFCTKMVTRDFQPHSIDCSIQVHVFFSTEGVGSVQVAIWENYIWLILLAIRMESMLIASNINWFHQNCHNTTTDGSEESKLSCFILIMPQMLVRTQDKKVFSTTSSFTENWMCWN